MANKKTAVFGIYQNVAQAERTVDQLLAAHFRNDDISVLLPDNKSTKDFAHEKNTKAPEGTTTGVATGGAIGGTLGLLAGIGALAIPGVGPFIAAGPIMAALGGAAVGTATGGIIGALVGLGIPEFEAKRYDAKIREGNILISVHTEDSKQRDIAKDVFKRNHADDISTGSEANPK